MYLFLYASTTREQGVQQNDNDNNRVTGLQVAQTENPGLQIIAKHPGCWFRSAAALRWGGRICHRMMENLRPPRA